MLAQTFGLGAFHAQIINIIFSINPRKQHFVFFQGMFWINLMLTSINSIFKHYLE